MEGGEEEEGRRRRRRGGGGGGGEGKKGTNRDAYPAQEVSQYTSGNQSRST